ncbi:glycosyltransferase family 2 protein [Aquincola sp. J276]|uniref:glycosyltransferase family 2 protein n=1 Tax=Aquincola sp. J276 TaxID=2898432 RepID=UPI0021509E8A|nr:glycosyltransferase family 2 protein [Aquincola sp. J276]MCR5866967.1 glycosyltransferase [Aquincola sp. J276]
MNPRPILSICIPTYNRAGFLRECLSSLDPAELDGSVEVVVSDNASTDTTLAVLDEFKAALPLRYFVQSENLGPDRNFDAVVASAQGEYCWLLGSDDVVKPGGIRKLVAALTSLRTDIVQFGYVQGDLHLRPLHRAFPPPGRVGATSEAFSAHLAAQPNMSLLFTFISAYAFRRTVWMARQELVRTWIGTYYIQMFAMHSALAAGASLATIGDCLVVARGGNPNEFNVIPGRFIALDARTMTRLIREVYDDRPALWQAIGKPFRRSYPAKALVHVAANGGLNYLKESHEALIRLGHSKTLLHGLVLLERLKLLSTVKWLLDSRRRALKKIKSQGSPA